ncbi:MAG: hypothetical protein HC800_23415 [Phormidesmis sp. RL_2_1]|nr:hypothetical protein [Phormidesmis sp. RL_2_1]
MPDDMAGMAGKLPGKRKALLIGVPHYEAAGIRDLPIVRQDLATLQSALAESAYEVTTVGDECDDRMQGIAQTGLVKVRRALRQACREAKGVETLLLYFSGHGLHYQGQDYLVPADAVIYEPEDLQDYLLPVDIVETVASSPAKTVLWVIDACREGIKLEAIAGKAVGLQQWSQREIKLAGQKQFAVIYACSAGQFSYFSSGEGGYSLFTQAFAEALDPSHEAITLDEVIGATQARLNSLSQEHGKQSQTVKARYEDDAAGTLRNWEICQGAPKAEPEVAPLRRRQLGVPLPNVKLPTNFVPRPAVLEKVKQTLLGDEHSTLVVSAISGLGGLGKSVMAAAVVLDEAIQASFADGILWVTLGQKPDLQIELGRWIRQLDTSRDSYFGQYA